MKNKDIDGGNSFDWGRASKEYAQFDEVEAAFGICKLKQDKQGQGRFIVRWTCP